MYAADLHIHSKYSRATSADCVPGMLDFWARRKGIALLGSGDFTHPAWRQMLHEQLVPAEEGLYRLREDLRLPDAVGPRESSEPRFVISGEISSIYKQDGRVRKVHSLILLPSLEAAERLSARLTAIGNIHSDGRPILGLSARDLLEITLESCAEAVFIPAHIWTPHFALFGAMSGFDRIEECFSDLTGHIHALETGLSSDPPMNWRLSALDRYTLVSNSDAHSPARLGREMNLIEGEMSYSALRRALETGSAGGFAGTVELYPEEGKYHFDGHRNCHVCLSPVEAEAEGNLCPVCGRRMTMGVSHRVEQLADRPEGCARPAGAADYLSLIPLTEVIAACCGISANGVRAQARYEALLHALGPELTILKDLPVADIERAAGPAIAEGIRRMRAGQAQLRPGFDGEYGQVQLLNADEIAALSGQVSFLDGLPAAMAGRRVDRSASAARPAAGKADSLVAPAAEKMPAAAQQPVQAALSAPDPTAGLNEAQRQAVLAPERAVAVIAGPGTGKTRTLVARIAQLLASGVKPEKIAAVTFTNKAAAELKSRLQRHFVAARAIRGLWVGTFHSICLMLLQRGNPALTVLDEAGALSLAGDIVNGLALNRTPQKLLREIAAWRRQEMDAPDERVLTCWQERLRTLNALDFDGLLLAELADPEEVPFDYLLVDEYQDVSESQRLLTRKWSAGERSLFVIGDPDQSIYGFRGASARCFDLLAAERTELRRITLTINYRCTPEILACALPLIRHNPGEHLLEAGQPSGAPVRRVAVTDEMQEGIALAREIGRLVGGLDMVASGASQRKAHWNAIDPVIAPEREERALGFADIAVLYRTHRQAEALEKCLAAEGIPYVVSGREDYLNAPGVQAAVATLRLLAYPADRAALHFLLAPAELPEALPDTLPALCTLLESRGEAATRLAALLRECDGKGKRESPRRLLDRYARAMGIPATDADFDKLRSAAGMEQDLPSFLAALALGEEGDISRCSGKKYTPEAVRLTTLHGAKGLEFPVVFLAGLRRGLLPLETAWGGAADVEEERRLLYVGMTRAQQELILFTGPEDSAFLREIPRERVQVAAAAWQRKDLPGRQMSFLD